MGNNFQLPITNYQLPSFNRTKFSPTVVMPQNLPVIDASRR